MSDVEKIWVIVADHGCEGLGEPSMAFKTEADAQFAKNLVERIGHQSVRVVEVPMWKCNTKVEA